MTPTLGSRVKGRLRKTGRTTRDRADRLLAQAGYRLCGLYPQAVDSYLCSYPKSGRTWLRYMLFAYLRSTRSLPLDQNLQDMYRALPIEGNDRERGLPGYMFTRRSDVPLLVASHRPYDPIFTRTKVVFILRGVYDVLVSYYHHFFKFPGQVPDGSVGEFVRETAHDLAAYLNSWAEHLDEVHVVTYENLRVDPRAELERILRYLGEDPVVRIAVHEAVRAGRFDAMRRVEVEKGLAGHAYDPTDDRARQIRRGEVGSFGEYLSDRDVNAVTQTLHSELDPQLRKRLISAGLLHS